MHIIAKTIVRRSKQNVGGTWLVVPGKPLDYIMNGYSTLKLRGCLNVFNTLYKRSIDVMIFTSFQGW